MPRKAAPRKNSPQAIETQPTKTELVAAAPVVTPAPAETSPNGQVLKVERAKPLAKAAAVGGNGRPTPDAIRVRAFEIYQQRGSAGSEVEDWLRAERELLDGLQKRRPA